MENDEVLETIGVETRLSSDGTYMIITRHTNLGDLIYHESVKDELNIEALWKRQYVEYQPPKPVAVKVKEEEVSYAG